MSTTPMVQGRIRVSDRRWLLVERAAVLLQRTWRSVGRVWAQWRKQARRNLQAANSGRLGSVMGRAFAVKGARNRTLVVEERLTLGPKQHLYLIRCGEQRLLLASAVEGALQWMALPEEGGRRETETCDNTLFSEMKKVTSAKRRQGSSGTKAKSGARSRIRKAEAAEAEVGGAR